VYESLFPLGRLGAKLGANQRIGSPVAGWDRNPAMQATRYVTDSRTCDNTSERRFHLDKGADLRCPCDTRRLWGSSDDNRMHVTDSRNQLTAIRVYRRTFSDAPTVGLSMARVFLCDVEPVRGPERLQKLLRPDRNLGDSAPERVGE